MHTNLNKRVPSPFALTSPSFLARNTHEKKVIKCLPNLTTPNPNYFFLSCFYFSFYKSVMMLLRLFKLHVHVVHTETVLHLSLIHI